MLGESTRRLVARFARCAVVALLVVSGVGVVASSNPIVTAARAADLSQFQAGNIISDSLFFDPNAMSVDQIQAFLDSQVPSCASGYTCLKDYTETTRTVDASPMCGAYSAATDESAATIIYRVGRLCGISSKAILVILQKEQGLVTATAPSARRYQAAMGAGCPDTAACDANYYGFFNQVRYGAYLLKRYTQPPGTGAGTWWDSRFDLMKPVGQVSQIQYNPDPGCGTQDVYVANQATHSLYLYTPYTPNAAALAAGYGIGDGCSAYGNRNFFQYYTDWFGSTQGGPANTPDPTSTPPAGSTTPPTPPDSGSANSGPSLADLQAARGNEAATAAQVDAISQQVAGLEGSAAESENEARQKASIADKAEANLRQATASVATAQARLDTANAQAARSARDVAALAAALYRSGASDPAMQMLAQTGTSASTLLDRMGTLNKLSERFDLLVTRSKRDQNESQSASAQATRTRAEFQARAVVARAAADAAEAAATAARDIVAANQSKLDDLYSQLSALQYSTALLEKEYHAG